MRASARSLHLYASVAVCRRPSPQATDRDAPPARARALRWVAAAVIRCALPSAARWHRLPSAEGRVSLSALPEAWQAAADDAVRAARRGDVDAAANAAAALSGLVHAGGLRMAAAMLAEAAALCALDNAERALRVTRLASARADHTAAEWWGRRTAGIAKRHGTWSVAVAAWACVATAHRERGQHRAAVVAVRREVRAAKRARSRDQHARALHSLFVTYAAAGDFGRAAKTALRTLRAYPNGHPRLFAFAYDLARFHLDRGTAAAALTVIQGLGSVFPTNRETLLVLASTAEAAAKVGDRTLLRRAVMEADAILHAVERGNGVAWTLATLAAAVADGLADHERAASWASEALRFAEEHGEEEPARTARRVLDTCSG